MGPCPYAQFPDVAKKLILEEVYGPTELDDNGGNIYLLH